ncbi:MAG: hypothetical protein ACI9VO_000607 [Colwellia sp.]
MGMHVSKLDRDWLSTSFFVIHFGLTMKHSLNASKQSV